MLLRLLTPTPTLHYKASAGVLITTSKTFSAMLSPTSPFSESQLFNNSPYSSTEPFILILHNDDPVALRIPSKALQSPVRSPAAVIQAAGQHGRCSGQVRLLACDEDVRRQLDEALDAPGREAGVREVAIRGADVGRGEIFLKPVPEGGGADVEYMLEYPSVRGKNSSTHLAVSAANCNR